MKHYIPASFSQGPVTSLQSMLRAIAFVEQQFPVISATGLFDEDTLEAVLRFQKQNYLPVTGIVDEETWDSIASAFINAYRQLPPISVPPYALDNRSIHPGQSYPALYPIQGMLNGLSSVLDGITAVASTGSLDPTTEQNLCQIQRMGHAIHHPSLHQQIAPQHSADTNHKNRLPEISSVSFL